MISQESLYWGVGNNFKRLANNTHERGNGRLFSLLCGVFYMLLSDVKR